MKRPLNDKHIALAHSDKRLKSFISGEGEGEGVSMLCMPNTLKIL